MTGGPPFCLAGGGFRGGGGGRGRGGGPSGGGRVWRFARGGGGGGRGGSVEGAAMIGLRAMVGVLVAGVGTAAAAPVPGDHLRPADDEVPPAAVRLLHHPKVRDELKLTDGQENKFTDGLARIERDL